MTFQDGMIANLTASRVTEEKIRRLSATTVEAHITLDYLSRSIHVTRWARLGGESPDRRTYRQESIVERIFVPQEEPLLAQLRSFLRCVTQRSVPEVGLDMGVLCLEVVQEVRQAADLHPSLEVAA
jgi:predicted dehydrogenase